MPRGKPFAHPRKNSPGRPKGAISKVTYDVRMIAQEYTVDAVKLLWAIANKPKTPAVAKILAIREILDRAHGKSAQPLTNGNNGGGGVIVELITFADAIRRPTIEHQRLESDHPTRNGVDAETLSGAPLGVPGGRREEGN